MALNPLLVLLPTTITKKLETSNWIHILENRTNSFINSQLMHKISLEYLLELKKKLIQQLWEYHYHLNETGIPKQPLFHSPTVFHGLMAHKLAQEQFDPHPHKRLLVPVQKDPELELALEIELKEY